MTVSMSNANFQGFQARAGEVINEGQCCHIGADGKAYIASNDVEAKRRARGVAFSSITAAELAAGKFIRLTCVGRHAGFSGLTPNENLYLGINGAVTHTKPSTPESVYVGFAVSTTEAWLSFEEPSSVDVIQPGSVTDSMLATDVKVGSLAALTTAVKTSVVGAVNAVNAKTATSVAAVAAANGVAAAGANPTKAEYDVVVTLANETKAQLNSALAALKTAGLMTT